MEIINIMLLISEIAFDVTGRTLTIYFLYLLLRKIIKRIKSKSCICVCLDNENVQTSE